MAFGVGLFLVMPSNSRLIEALPVVGEWIKSRRASLEPVVDQAVLTTSFRQEGVEKYIRENGIITYLVRGRLLDDVVVRQGDNLLQGKIVVDGHLQSQPIDFLAGSVDGMVYFGIERDKVISYTEARSVQTADYLKAGTRVELSIQYNPSDKIGAEQVVSLEGLAQAMREDRRYESERPHTLYALKLSALE